MTYDRIAELAAAEGLSIFGGFHPALDDGCPEGTETLILLCPSEPGFWGHVTATPEFLDGTPDPIDRWSTRVISALAMTTGGTAVYPFGGPPYLPFIAWATRTGRAWASPVGMLVHDKAGLMISIRGALALPFKVDLPATGPCPCDSCDQPCRTACPVDALGTDGYNLPACHAFLDTADGAGCMTQGCKARRACPISATSGRLPVQSAHHMRHFHQ